MERPAIIRKIPHALAMPPWHPPPGEGAAFWNAIRHELPAPIDGTLNIAHEAVTRHAEGARRDHIAMRFVGETKRDISYGELDALTNRFANTLTRLGIRRGECLFTLCGRIPELYIAVLGAFKAGVVVSPLFPAFGPEPVATRVALGKGAALVTTSSLLRRKVESMRTSLPSLRHILAIDDGEGIPADALDLGYLLDGASDSFETVATQADDAALLHFTSGTTGTPKGAIHAHEALLAHWSSGRYALDLHPSDIYWCTADPGWVTGMSYGIITPLLHGVTSIIDSGEFDAARWYRILADERISIWYTAPTAIRMLMKAGTALARQHSYPMLRFIASVGEPLNPEAVWWGMEAFGLPIHDNWWQTETGAIMIANTVGADIKPGSMGKPQPGITAAIVRRREDGSIDVIDAPGQNGELALKTPWPSLMRGYLDNDERFRKCFADGWYLSGDIARRDAEGDYWFIGREDDVIKSAGHLIGPFEVESVLLEHPAVAEAGVIGKPDPVTGESVKAFVSLNPGFVPDTALRLALLGHARSHLGASIAPKEIAFIDSLPRTRSGKILRRLLKARELGLPEGDLSTLEGNS